MVPISRRKQMAGIAGALVLGYSLSWLSTPGPGTGPVDTFSPTFGESVAPVIVAPAEVAPAPENSSFESFQPLQANANEPI